MVPVPVPPQLLAHVSGPPKQPSLPPAPLVQNGCKNSGRSQAGRDQRSLRGGGGGGGGGSQGREDSRPPPRMTPFLQNLLLWTATSAKGPARDVSRGHQCGAGAGGRRRWGGVAPPSDSKLPDLKWKVWGAARACRISSSLLHSHKL